MKLKLLAAMLASTAAIGIQAQTAHAQDQQTSYDIGSQRLADALLLYSETSGQEVIASSTLIDGKRSNRITCRLSPYVALNRPLAATAQTLEVVAGIRRVSAGERGCQSV